VWQAITWPFRPIRVPVPPALALAAGAALALFVFVWRGGGPTTAGETAAGVVQPASLKAPAAPTRVYVELRFDAPDASSVAVAGDFTNWQPTLALQDRDGDGVWTGLVPMSPGIHQYMFVIDGTRWVTDPGAARHVDDGFGHRNAVVAVAAPAGA
jgi:1,4-alpha-glucan branching enzyme